MVEPAVFFSNYIAAVLAVLLSEAAGGEIVVSAEAIELFLDHPVTLSITKRGDDVVVSFSSTELPDGQLN